MMSSKHIIISLSLYSKAHAAAKALIDIESVSSFAVGISCSKAMALQGRKRRRVSKRPVAEKKPGGLIAKAVSSSQ